MLHIALVANLMSAIGAAPGLGRPNFPQRSGYFPADVQLDLLPFGERALDHFLFLERPEGVDRPDAAEFVGTALPRDPVDEHETLPRGQEFMTVGHLYRGIADGLRALSSRLGERALFVGSPRAQATPELFHWPQLVAVTTSTHLWRPSRRSSSRVKAPRGTGRKPTTDGSCPSARSSTP
jgi:Ferritin-like